MYSLNFGSEKHDHSAQTTVPPHFLSFTPQFPKTIIITCMDLKTAHLFATFSIGWALDYYDVLGSACRFVSSRRIFALHFNWHWKYNPCKLVNWTPFRHMSLCLTSRKYTFFGFEPCLASLRDITIQLGVRKNVPHLALVSRVPCSIKFPLGLDLRT